MTHKYQGEDTLIMALLNRQDTINKKLNHFRHSLAYIDALPQLTLLGLVIGIVTGLIIVAFRSAVAAPLAQILPGHADNFEALSSSHRTILIMSGSAVLGLTLQWLGKYRSQLSVTHVLDRLHNHQGKLPKTNIVAQFFLAIICLTTGQSTGREGPAVHLGAGVASQLGQWLRLPNNSMQALIGCGVAAAISASFDTPMAGVIFAMEVIVMEYTIIGFVPVILASVMGTAVSQLLMGNPSDFIVGDTNMNSLLELPYMAAISILIALCAGSYIRLNTLAMSVKKIPIVIRVLIAGVLTAGVAHWVPSVMGLGYDTVNAAIAGNIALSGLIVIALSKLVLTPIVIGLGVPGGVIGPSLVVGACIGGIMGNIAQHLFPTLGIDPSFYAVLGMASMMAATINAPLAALVCVLELSYNPNIIFPAMLMIVVACVLCRQIFKVEGIFIEQLKKSGRNIESGPAELALKRAGVHSIMDSKISIAEAEMDYEQAKKLLISKPRWIVIDNLTDKYGIPASDLAKFLENAPIDVLSLEVQINMLEIPGRQVQLFPIHETASLHEAMQALNAKQCTTLYVSQPRTPTQSDVSGILTLTAIQNYYQPRGFHHAVD